MGNQKGLMPEKPSTQGLEYATVSALCVTCLLFLQMLGCEAAKDEPVQMAIENRQVVARRSIASANWDRWASSRYGKYAGHRALLAEEGGVVPFQELASSKSGGAHWIFYDGLLTNCYHRTYVFSFRDGVPARVKRYAPYLAPALRDFAYSGMGAWFAAAGGKPMLATTLEFAGYEDPTEREHAFNALAGLAPVVELDDRVITALNAGLVDTEARVRAMSMMAAMRFDAGVVAPVVAQSLSNQAKVEISLEKVEIFDMSLAEQERSYTAVERRLSYVAAVCFEHITDEDFGALAAENLEEREVAVQRATRWARDQGWLEEMGER